MPRTRQNEDLLSLQSGYALPARHQILILILIDAGLSSCLSRCTRRRISSQELALFPDLKPVVIPAGAIGNTRELKVSPQHGIKVADYLVRAKHLAEEAGSEIAFVDHDADSVTYVHFMCERHEVVFAEGLATETMYPGPGALEAIGTDAVQEIVAVFPELESYFDGSASLQSVFGERVRPLAKRSELRGVHANSTLTQHLGLSQV